MENKVYFFSISLIGVAGAGVPGEAVQGTPARWPTAWPGARPLPPSQSRNAHRFSFA
jgi:hypothetical protein